MPDPKPIPNDPRKPDPNGKSSVKSTKVKTSTKKK